MIIKLTIFFNNFGNSRLKLKKLKHIAVVYFSYVKVNEYLLLHWIGKSEQQMPG